MSHDILVMKDGKAVESEKASDIFDHPKETYTQDLMEAALYLAPNLSSDKTNQDQTNANPFDPQINCSKIKHYHMDNVNFRL